MDRVAPPFVKLHVIDVALMYDHDHHSPGVYLAAGPESVQTGSVGGAAVYWSRDGSAYEYLLTLPIPATIGVLTTDLDFIATSGIDDESSCNVLLSHGELTSITADEQLQGNNIAIVDDEVLSFRTATLIEPSEYTISGLLRGLAGTEHNVETHVAERRFILFKHDEVPFVPLTPSMLGATIYFKAAYPGQDLDDITATEITFAGGNVAPLCPTSLVAIRDGSNNLQLSWLRRTRREFSPFAGPEAPIGEERTRYEVEFWNSAGTVLYRTVTGLTSETANYTAAQQTADGATPGQQYLAKVMQLGTFIESPQGSAIV